ncbi:MAG: DUF805 domain-containing protein [Oscillospiraceae bacterium]|nr:DUF805 domain-containing protein [Oscillospiraceae bacterium]
MRYYVKAFRNYTNIHGRANRKEYWCYMLINYILMFLFAFLDGVLGLYPSSISLGYGYLTFVYLCLTALPSICLGIRRMHDIGKSGYWYLCVGVPILNFYFIYLTFRAGDSEINEYGAPSDWENGGVHHGQRDSLAQTEGRNLSSQRQYCSKCGFELLGGSSFCSRCGERVNVPTNRTAQHMDWEISEKPRKKWWILLVGMVVLVGGVIAALSCFGGMEREPVPAPLENTPQMETPEPQPTPEVPKPEPEPTPKPEPETPPALPEQPAEQESEETAFTFLRDWILENYNVELPKDDGSDKSYTETAAEENVEYIFRIIYSEDYDEICLFYVNRYPVSDAMFLSLLWLKPSDTVYLAEWFNYDTANIDEANEAFWGYCDLPAVSLTENALVFDGFEGEVEDGDVELYQSVAQEMCLESVYFLDYVLQNASADAGKSYSAEDFGFHLEYSE